MHGSIMLTTPTPYPRLCSSAVSHCQHHRKKDFTSQLVANSISLSVPQNTDECPICALSPRDGADAAGDSAECKEVQEDAVKETGKEENHLEERGEEVVQRKRRTCFGYLIHMWTEMRKKLWGIVESKYFSRGIMIAILINTISMGIEHHNQVRPNYRYCITNEVFIQMRKVFFV